jgi:type IV pilus assembly protein PilE
LPSVEEASASGGFTLIEMMIAMVLVGILASIAIPNYQAQVAKARRTDAQIALFETAQKLERCYSQFGSYNDAACTAALPVLEHYTITIATRTASNYSLSAAASTGSPQVKDVGCLTFTLNQDGSRGATHATGHENTVCWNE